MLAFVGRGIAGGLLAALLISSGSASASFTAPVQLSPNGQVAFNPALGMDGVGNSVVAWGTNSGQVHVRGISAAGVLEPRRVLANANAGLAQVATAADGASVAAWEVFDGANERIQARTISPAGVLGPKRFLSPPGIDAFDVRLATAAGAPTLAIWTQFVGPRQQIQARTISPASALGHVRSLSPASQNSTTPRIAMNPAGDSILVWAVSDSGGGVFRVQARSLSVGGALGPIQTLSSTPQNGRAPDVAIDDDGDAIVAWYNGTPAEVRARTISSTGVLGPIRGPVLAQSIPQVATDADGDSIVVGGPRFQGVDARLFSSTGSLGAPLHLADAPASIARVPDVVSDAAGNSVVVWEEDPYGDGNEVQARTISAGGTLGPLQSVGPGLVDPDTPAFPHVAGNAGGDAAAVWVGPQRTILFARGP